MRQRDRDRLEEKARWIEKAEKRVGDAICILEKYRDVPMGGTTDGKEVPLTDCLEWIEHALYQWRGEVAAKMRDDGE